MMVPSLIRLVLCLLLYYLPGTLVCFRFEIFVPSINPRCSVSLGVGWLSISLFRFTGRKVFAQGGQVFGGRSSRRLQESKTVQQNAPTHAQGETTLSFTFPPPSFNVCLCPTSPAPSPFVSQTRGRIASTPPPSPLRCWVSGRTFSIYQVSIC